MKKLFLVIAVAIVTLFSCTKQASQQPASEKMNGIEFKAKYGFELPFLDYTSTGSEAQRGRKPKAQTATLAVSEDLVISGSVESTTSPNAQWGGIQLFYTFPISTDSALSYCNYYWSRTGTDFPPASMVCPTTAPGWYRGWTSDAVASDTPYDVHLSPVLAKN